jgi:predicted TIM-barrel fold metal-dependent hydrolase
VVFHTGDTDSRKAKLKYADPLTIDEVAVDHPNVTFVLAHAGNPWIQSAAEVAYKNPNVVIDGSAFLIGDLASRSPEIVETQLVAPVRWLFEYVADPKKLMFGTDWPLVRMEPYLRAFQKAIPREHWQAVFHDNAARVYGLQ